MKTKILFAAVLAALVAGGALAQSGPKQSGPKLYRWVDKQGKVHYDDALPPEAVNEARKEFNAETGSHAGDVERALTPEERAAIEAAKQREADAAKVAEELRHQEEVMMLTYSNENDMRRAYGERITLLKTTLDSTDVSIRNVRENLALMLTQASEAELGGRKVPPERDAAIRELHTEYLKQQQFQANRRVELDALNAEFARMLNRYRELKNPAAAPAATAGTPPPAAPAPGGAR